jgi:predicted  nucleic acid-binding Zn-ribbon protein
VAFKLSKQEIATRDEHVEKLEKAWADLQQAVNAYNEAETKQRELVDKAVADYNDVMNEAKSFAEEIANRTDGEYEDKSEKWREGEKGQAAAEFKYAWQSIDMEEIELAWPVELDIDDPDHAPELAELPTEAG